MHIINTISTESQNYLQILPTVDKTIKSLYFIGNIPANRTPTVAIVGTRKPTAYGNEIAYKLAYDLAAKGIVIVSGLALGIDGVAHKAALDAHGTTIAVLANGLDKIYPATHQQLGERIIDGGGAIVSEYGVGVEGYKYKANLLERNRIVSGLCDALVIVEAAQRSGTLNTAAHALAQGKLVCAVPGNVTSYASSGCNKLLQQGATLITCADDVLNELGLNHKQSQAQKQLIFGDTPEEEKILSLMRTGVRDGYQLQQQSSLSASIFNQTLTMLEIKGTIRALGANNWGIG